MKKSFCRFASEESRLKSKTCATPFAALRRQPWLGRFRGTSTGPWTGPGILRAGLALLEWPISLCSLNALRCHRRLLRFRGTSPVGGLGIGILRAGFALLNDASRAVPSTLALPSATHTLPCGRGSVNHSKTRDTFRAATARERFDKPVFSQSRQQAQMVNDAEGPTRKSSDDWRHPRSPAPTKRFVPLPRVPGSIALRRKVRLCR